MPFAKQGPYTVGGTFTNANATNMEIQYDEATNSFEQDLLTPFVFSGLVATKDGVTASQLDVTAGVAFPLQTDNTLRRRAPVSSTQSTVGHASTTMYLDLNPDGTWSWATTHSAVSGHLTIATVVTDASANISTVTDARTLNTTVMSGMAGNVAFPGGVYTNGGSASLNAGIGGIFYNAGQNALGIAPALAGGIAQGIYFATWDGAASHIPFSMGGQFAGALAWVDNNGGFNLSGAVLIGSAVSGSQSSLSYSSTDHALEVFSPTAGGVAQGVRFVTWNGSSAIAPFSVGGQFGSALAYVDTSGRFHDNAGLVVVEGANNSITPLKLSAGISLPGSLGSREVFFLLA